MILVKIALRGVLMNRKRYFSWFAALLFSAGLIFMPVSCNLQISVAGGTENTETEDGGSSGTKDESTSGSGNQDDGKDDTGSKNDDKTSVDDGNNKDSDSQAKTEVSVADRTLSEISGNATYEFTAEISGKSGDSVEFFVTVSGASNYSQLGFQTKLDNNTWHEYVWQNNGIPDGTVYTQKVTAGSDFSSVSAKYLIQHAIDSSKKSDIKLTKISVKVISSSSESGGGSSESGGNTETGGGTDVPDADVTAGSDSVTMAKNMTIGWNLGNSLDATNDGTNQGTGTETAWSMPVTTQAMIDAVRAAGFKTVRIPVSWYNHVSTDGKYTVNSVWMARVKQVVDYAYNKGMFVILNVHHDNISISDLNSGKTGYALSADSAVKTKSKAFLSAVWEQIAGEFKGYDEKLVFEVLNEPRDIGGQFGGNEWWTTDKNILNVVTEYEQTCIDAIRAVSGGCQYTRYLMVPCYAATSDLQIIPNYTMPKDADSAKDRLIFSVHAYSPYKFAMYDNNNPDTTFDDDDRKELDQKFTYYKTNFVDKGIGVVIGEASASNKGNLSEREKWFTYYFSEAYKKGMPVVLWDNGAADANAAGSEQHGYLNRTAGKWYFPTLIKKAMDAVGVTEYSIPE